MAVLGPPPAHPCCLIPGPQDPLPQFLFRCWHSRAQVQTLARAPRHICSLGEISKIAFCQTYFALLETSPLLSPGQQFSALCYSPVCVFYLNTGTPRWAAQLSCFPLSEHPWLPGCELTQWFPWDQTPLERRKPASKPNQDTSIFLGCSPVPCCAIWCEISTEGGTHPAALDGSVSSSLLQLFTALILVVECWLSIWEELLSSPGSVQGKLQAGRGKHLQPCQSAELLPACAAQAGGGWAFLAKIFAIWADRVFITSCFFACSVKICLHLRTDDICGVQVGCSKRPRFVAWCIDLKDKECLKFCVFWIVLVGH